MTTRESHTPYTVDGSILSQFKNKVQDKTGWDDDMLPIDIQWTGRGPPFELNTVQFVLDRLKPPLVWAPESI